MILEVASYEFLTLGVYGVTISVAFGIDCFAINPKLHPVKSYMSL
jgi:hypothetical protein